MARLYALADLHLSEAGHKPMEVFGELWKDHARRMAGAWDARVSAEDTVLLPGDLSWGRNLAEAEPDLRWIGDRPGRKLLLRGNHDGWWTSLARVRRALPADCELLQNNAHRIGDWVVVGARGWTAPDDPMATPADEAVYRRELERLRLSIEYADREFGRGMPRLAMMHYPPRIEGGGPTPVVERLREAGVRLVVYGHLHGADHALALRGEHEGLIYVFAAADAVGFAPLELELPDIADPSALGGSDP